MLRKMCRVFTIFVIVIASFGSFPSSLFGRGVASAITFEFYGHRIALQGNVDLLAAPGKEITEEKVAGFYESLSSAAVKPLIDGLTAYQSSLSLDDWIFYQLIRKTAQQVYPKASHFEDYTLLKWGLLLQTGYDALLVIRETGPYLYVRSDESIYNVPVRNHNGGQYVCLNNHDFPDRTGNERQGEKLIVEPPRGGRLFSYRITRLPDFNPAAYREKLLSFEQHGSRFVSTVKVNGDIPQLFINYPVVDYADVFNIPMSRGTYESLIPLLRSHVRGMSQADGVAILMNFTRYAFLFESDESRFGGEKRLSPEETLLHEKSDCEDRAALFYMLVREIYNLPMVVIVYPQHVSIGVAFDRPFGVTVRHEGRRYTICEPTPQKRDLKIGEIMPELQKSAFDIVHSYMPSAKH